ELQKITPLFSWDQYFNEMGLDKIQQINLATPKFFKMMNTELQEISLDEWKAYLRWHLIQGYAPYLSQPFVNENFQMVSAITGVKKILPRWQRVIATEDGALGYAIGKLYIAATFPPSSKIAVQEIVNNIRLSLRKNLTTLSWMTPKTRKAALLK